MMSVRIAAIIPAIKKNVAFPDDLIKKLEGKTLVARAIDKAIALAGRKSVFLVTDSEEIRLIGERHGVSVYWDPGLNWLDSAMSASLYRFLLHGPANSAYCVLLSPYAPLLDAADIEDAVETLVESGMDMLKPVKEERRQLFDDNGRTLLQYVFGTMPETHRLEYRGFSIFRGSLLQGGLNSHPVSMVAYPVPSDVIEINSFQDWWICEKLLRRKRIVFRVIGDAQVGMGHIYRALSLAHEISDHQIMFVCDEQSLVAASQLAGSDYWIGVYPQSTILERMIELNPDLVVNDILNTGVEEVRSLQEQGIRVVNFEDMGEGARLADLTINELYDEPRFASGNALWGHEHFFVRDEFNDARPHRFRSKVDNLLLVFGGTDQLNLSQSIYRAVRGLCRKNYVNIHIVTGPGYEMYEELEREVAACSDTTLTRSTGVISSLMERCQIAITSNGRTVYEMAHMNIPAIVIAQHDREKTHAFACPENGFLPVGIYKKDKTESLVLETLARLVMDVDFRQQLFRRTTRFRFSRNKGRVVKRILALIEDTDG